MIIFEGTDLVGKTTAARTVLRDPRLDGYIYAHFSKLPVGFHRYWGYVERSSMHVVQDRFHMSEPVYSRVRGEDESPLTPNMYRLVDARMRLLSAFTVVITADDELIASRSPHEDEMYPLSGILLANKLFTNIATQGGFGDYRMDVDVHLHCTSENPYATDQQLKDIVTAYLRRRDHLERIAAVHRVAALV